MKQDGISKTGASVTRTGAEVGAEVKVTTGAVVGTELRSTTGAVVGAEVRFTTGAAVGAEVRFTTGAAVGADVRFKSGAVVGDEVGVELSSTGAEVGAEVSFPGEIKSTVGRLVSIGTGAMVGVEGMLISMDIAGIDIDMTSIIRAHMSSTTSNMP